MGNCVCVINKPMTSSGDDRGSFNKRRTRRRRSTVFHDDDEIRENLLGETSTKTSSSSSSSCVGREIKIRMTKKELEDLMRNIGLKSLTTEEILCKLLIDDEDPIGFSTIDLSNHHRAWKPALQSIPETE